MTILEQTRDLFFILGIPLWDSQFKGSENEKNCILRDFCLLFLMMIPKSKRNRENGGKWYKISITFDNLQLRFLLQISTALII